MLRGSLGQCFSWGSHQQNGRASLSTQPTLEVRWKGAEERRGQGRAEQSRPGWGFPFAGGIQPPKIQGGEIKTHRQDPKREEDGCFEEECIHLEDPGAGCCGRGKPLWSSTETFPPHCFLEDRVIRMKSEPRQICHWPSMCIPDSHLHTLHWKTECWSDERYGVRVRLLCQPVSTNVRLQNTAANPRRRCES